MQHTHDFKFGFSLSIENYVFSCGKETEAFVDVVAWGAKAGRLHQGFEFIPDLAQVFSLLGRSPFAPGIVSDLHQICFRGIGDVQFLKAGQRMRPALRRSSRW